MNLPNKLTLLRICMIPIFCAAMYLPFTWARWLSLFLFAAACLTDFADGRIARKRGLVTTFGKFMDPIADKILVMAAFVILVEQGGVPAWAAIVILAREFIVSGFRLVAADKGVVIAAGYLGKFKTVSQMLSVILTIALYPGSAYTVAYIVTVIAVIMTAWSGFDYIYKNRACIKEQ